MNSSFTIKGWSAFAPGLTQQTEWLAWAADPFLPHGEATPALAEMPPMLRRRVDKLGRMALQVAWWCQQDREENVPLVFASRHGDLSRTYDMLRALAQEQPLSPTHFGLSTHNAIAAQYSIARNLGGNCVCVSAGTATAEAAVIEALGLLADGFEEVLLVAYDCPLPEGYAAYGDEPEAPFAWTARIGRAGTGDVYYSLQVAGGERHVDATAARLLPAGLEVLRFLIGDLAMLEHEDDGRTWLWRRHA
jgi:Beta-ketoacyl synthase, N-terminal domain